MVTAQVLSDDPRTREQRGQVHRVVAVQRIGMIVQERIGRRLPRRLHPGQQARRGHELGPGGQVVHQHFVPDHVDQGILHRAVLQPAFRKQALDEVDGPQVGHQGCVEADLVHAVGDLGGAAGNGVAQQRVDVHDDDVAGQVLAIQREHRRIAGKATIPEGLQLSGFGVADFDRAKQGGQAGRGHDGVRRGGRMGKDPDPASAHIGGRDEQLRTPVVAEIGKGQVAQHRAQGIHVKGTIVVRAENARQVVHPGQGGKQFGQAVHALRGRKDRMQIWRAQGLAPVAPRGTRHRPLHGGAADEGDGIARRCSWQEGGHA